MIGYLGPEQSFTHQAAMTLNSDHSLKAYPTIRSLFVALRQNEVDSIVVPIENSTEGSVTTTVDALAEESVYITHELYLPIQLSLYSNAASIKDITHVMSHPQALAQCRIQLEQLLGDYTEVPTTSTSSSVEALRTSEAHYAAVASPGFTTIKEVASQIQDIKNNETRFVVLQRTPQTNLKANKTSLLFKPTEDRPGLLYDLLHEFAIRKINLTRIESRKSKSDTNIFVFYLDALIHMDDPALQEILTILKVKRFDVKLLGTYLNAK
jgi:prephenate dehydratase